MGSLLAQKICVFSCSLAHLLERIAQPELLLGRVIVVQHAGVGAGAGGGGVCA